MSIEEGNMKKFTVDDVESCWTYYKEYLVDILNGEYSVESAREDLGGLVGSEYDPRVNPFGNTNKEVTNA